MKRTLTALALIAMLGTAQAGYRGGHYGHHHHARGGSGWGWVVPAIVGGTVVYMATRPAQAEPAPTVIVNGNQSTLPQVNCPIGTYPTWNMLYDTQGRQTGYQFMGCQPR